MGKTYKITMIAIFIIPLIAFSLLLLLTDDRDFSESENRVLQTMPEFSTYGLFKGKYTKTFETYISDQFPFRDSFVAGKTMLDKSMLKKEGNGVYFGDNGYLLQKINTPSESTMDKAVNNILAMKKEGYKISTLFIPSSALVYNNLLPKYVDPEKENDSLDYLKNSLSGKVNNIELRNDLIGERDNYLYYRTDHHLTSRGSYRVYRSYMDSINRPSHNIADYRIEDASNSFYGSLYSKVIDISLSPDTINLYHLRNSESSYRVTRDGKVYNDIYFRERLKEKDKYKVFLNDNYPYMKITGNQKASEELVIIKDSYANSIIPFLLDHYRSIHVVDPRYYNTGMKDVLESINCKKLLYIFSLENINFIK
ncbi:MAG: DHHW family protein [Clostridium sp.]